jgi:hypothetical protein
MQFGEIDFELLGEFLNRAYGIEAVSKQTDEFAPAPT